VACQKLSLFAIVFYLLNGRTGVGNIRCQGEFFGPLTCEIKEFKCEKTSRQVAGLPSKELIALYL
jgi:hypothetical protein